MKFVRKRGRPRKAPNDLDGNFIHVRVGDTVFAWLNAEWQRRGVPSRAEAIRAIFDEARIRSTQEAAE